MVGGGYVQDTTERAKTFMNYPSSDTQWSIATTEFGTAGRFSSVRLKLLCSSLIEAQIVTGTPTQIAPNGTDGTATATCPAGTLALVGGWTQAPASEDTSVWSSLPTSTNGWELKATNFGSSDLTLTAYVMCGKAKDPAKTLKIVPEKNTERTAIGAVTASTVCLGNQSVTGAGFVLSTKSQAASMMTNRLFVGVGTNEALVQVKYPNNTFNGITPTIMCASIYP